MKVDFALCSRDFSRREIVRQKHTGQLSERNADQQLRQAVDYRAALMRRIDSQDLVFDA